MSQKNSIDFGELSADADFTSRVEKFHASVDKIGELLQNACGTELYDKLNLDDRIKYDLFLSYSLNSLFWLYLRTQGVDPSKHAIKSEIDRVREYNNKAKQAQDRRTVMPRIDVAAAQRFIRSGLWQPNQKENEGDDGAVNRQRVEDDDDHVEG